MTQHSDKQPKFVLNFLVAGMRKCATTWLYELFRLHPEVIVSDKVKESGFFTRHFSRGTDWYASLFDDATTSANTNTNGEVGRHRLIGEVDPNNLQSATAPVNLQSTFPACQVIGIFRNPADMFFSAYDHEVRKGDTSLSPEQAWEQLPHLREQLQYGRFVQNYLACFPREQLLFLAYEEIDRDKTAFLNHIQNFLQLEQPFEAAAIGRLNVARNSRYPWLNKQLVRAARLARSLDLHWLVNLVKRSVVGRHQYHEQSREEVEKARQGPLRGQIIAAMAEEIRQFRQLSGIAVEQYWPETKTLFDSPLDTPGHHKGDTRSNTHFDDRA